MPPSSVSLGSPNRNDGRDVPIDGEQEVEDDRRRGSPRRRSPIAHRTPVAMRSRDAASARIADGGAAASSRRAERGGRRTTNANEIRSSTRPIVQRAWFHGSPATVLPMSRVIWLVSVVIGCGQAGRHRSAGCRSPSGRRAPRRRPASCPARPPSRCRSAAAGMRTWRIVCQRVVPSASEPCAGPAGSRRTTS